MKMTDSPRWDEHHAAWRDPRHVVNFSTGDLHARADFTTQITGPFWDLVEQLGVTILVSREYEHLLVALTVRDGRPHMTYLPLPHPSGITVDLADGRVWVACTRNPNQILELRPTNLDAGNGPQPTLVPASARFLPGRTYLHDLALINGVIHANSVGSNSVIRVTAASVDRVWWPRSIEAKGVPDFERNYLQLNSIAAGPSLAGSYFTASAVTPSSRRPGHRNFAVDRRGALFSGMTREPVAFGLTRPHSARFQDNRVWLDNSGYGEFGCVDGDRFVPLVRLPGWTRGLTFCQGYALVGTSRVIARFRDYAPGLDVDTARCGLHWVELSSGRCVASLTWPAGNQIFAIETLPAARVGGLPYRADGRGTKRAFKLFYAFEFSEKGATE
ncbi:MAG: DUF4915 domain-containing protein [Azospirillaceae bacterium]|nr:DUF4915 domain-containing protein [Azospirillaceae bacterium]